LFGEDLNCMTVPSDCPYHAINHFFNFRLRQRDRRTLRLEGLWKQKTVLKTKLKRTPAVTVCNGFVLVPECEAFV